MLQIVYASAAASPFTPTALTTLLHKARSRNTFYGVTGMLLYHSGSFLQVLEGEETDVNLIFASIQRDPRHHSAKVLANNVVRSREFGDWAMSFVDTSSSRTLTGLVDYHRSLPKLTLGATDAQRYLRFFREGLCRQTV